MGCTILARCIGKELKYIQDRTERSGNDPLPDLEELYLISSLLRGVIGCYGAFRHM